MRPLFRGSWQLTWAPAHDTSRWRTDCGICCHGRYDMLLGPAEGCLNLDTRQTASALMHEQLQHPSTQQQLLCTGANPASRAPLRRRVRPHDHIRGPPSAGHQRGAVLQEHVPGAGHPRPRPPHLPHAVRPPLLPFVTLSVTPPARSPAVRPSQGRPQPRPVSPVRYPPASCLFWNSIRCFLTVSNPVCDTHWRAHPHVLTLVTSDTCARATRQPRWFHWTVDQFLEVYNPPNAEVCFLHCCAIHATPSLSVCSNTPASLALCQYEGPISRGSVSSTMSCLTGCLVICRPSPVS